MPVSVEGKTIGQVLAETTSRHRDRDAVVFPRLNLRWSYAEFESQVQKVARSLMALGLYKGEHVGVWATNQPEWIVAQFAVSSIGGVLVNVNPAYRVHELAYVVEQSDLAILLLTDFFKTSNYEQMAVEAAPELGEASFGPRLHLRRFPKLRHVVSMKQSPSFDGIWPWNVFLEQGKETPHQKWVERSRQPKPDEGVNIQYTSGTTGSPKGATLSHSNILLNAYHVGGRMQFTEQDRLCIPVPFYHCFGCVMGTLMCAVYGAAMVVPAESFDPEATLDAVDAEACTGLYGVPTMFNAEIHSPGFDKRRFQSLRTGIMAGSPCPIELMRQVTTKMHLSEMTIAYGLTEASPVITQTETTEPLELRVTTVGKPLPGLEVILIDPATGEESLEGEQGELCVRGHGVMIGYYNKPEATKSAIGPDGWLRTGDLAVRTPTGHYKITGRIKDMIIRGGENIYPREIEEFLLTHPSIRDVQIVGLPDEKFGEEVSAWIILHEPGTIDADEVRAYCRANIAHYKTPRYVEIVNEYPLTVSGKVQKYKLREAGVAKYNLHQAAKEEMA